VSTLRRFQLDLTEDELRSIEHLGAIASIRTKKDVVLNAITLLRWATREVMYGRSICSIDERTGATKQVELPALFAVADKYSRMRAEMDELQANDQTAQSDASVAPQPEKKNAESSMDRRG